MKIDLRKLDEGINAFTFDETSTDLALDDLSVTFSGPIHTEMNVVKVGESLTASGTSSYKVQQECVRCLEPFAEHFSVEFRFILQKGEPRGPEEADDEAIIWIEEEAGMVDLSSDVRDYVLLEIPMNPVCREDCKGLCPSCGTNLNESTCDCTHEVSDPRWDALKALR